jgi:hypothetical protein
MRPTSQSGNVWPHDAAIAGHWIRIQGPGDPAYSARQRPIQPVATSAGLAGSTGATGAVRRCCPGQPGRTGNPGATGPAGPAAVCLSNRSQTFVSISTSAGTEPCEAIA